MKAHEWWASELPDEFLLCRDLGHTWQPYTASRADDGHYERVMRCVRCDTKRKQTLSASGVILTGGYDYPDGYTAPPGSGHMTADGRAGLRLVSVLRLLEPTDAPPAEPSPPPALAPVEHTKRNGKSRYKRGDVTVRFDAGLVAR